MPYAAVLPLRRLLSTAASRPIRTLFGLLVIAGIGAIVAQIAMAAVTLNPLTDGNDVARTAFKPGDVIKASGSVDDGKVWRFVRVNGSTGTDVTSCAGPTSGVTSVDTTYTVQSADDAGPWSFELRQFATVEDCAADANAETAAREYTVDKTAPTVMSIDRSGATPTNASSVSWTVTFNEDVTGVDAGDFDLAATGPTGASITGVIGSGTTWTVTAGTGSGDGTLGLDLVDDESIIDGVGNTLADGATGQTYTLDKTVPTVTSINRTGSSPTNDSSVSWTVTFSEDVTGVGAADLDLNTTGVSGAAITNVTGSGATRTVTVNTGSGDGTIRLDVIDDDSIVDAVGNALAAGATGQTYTIDKTAPTVTSINRDSSSPTNASSVTWTVTFSEHVTGVTAADFALTTALTGASITNVTGSGATRTVTANTGTGDGTIRLDLDDDDNSIIDPVGNALAAGTTGQSYTVDKTAPTVTSINRTGSSSTNASSVTWTVTYSEAVTGVGEGDFDLDTTGVTGSSITGVSGSGTMWTVIADTGSGDGTIRLDVIDDDSVIDTVGNALAAGTTGQSYTVDKTAPTVTSITRTAASPTNALSASWTVTFSEDVSGVTAADFDLTTGMTGTSITGVTGTGATRTVTASTGSGDGTIRLDLEDDDSIEDAAGNTLAGTGTDGSLDGEVYTVDVVVPTVTSIDRADSSPANGSSLTWTVTFTKAVTGVDAGDFDLVATGVTGASISDVAAGTGTAWTVTAETGSGDGTIRLDLVDDESIVDGVGNALDRGATGQSYTIDKTAPATTHAFSQPAPTDQVTVTLTSADADVAKTYFTKGSAPGAPAPNAANEYDPSNKPRLANGERIKYLSVDAVGNVEMVRESSAVTVQKPPTVSGATGSGATAGTTATVSVQPSSGDNYAPLATFASRLRFRLTDVLRDGVTARVTSGEEATATVRLFLMPRRAATPAAKPIVIATATKPLKPGVRRSVVVKLTKKGKSRLKKVRGTAKLSLRVSLRDTTGNIRYLRPWVLTVTKR